MRGAFSPDGKVLITASHDTTVRVWNNDLSVGSYGKLLRKISDHTDQVLHVGFNKLVVLPTYL
jgi:WD40 repeat protein